MAFLAGMLLGIFLGFAALALTVFYCIKKQDGTLMSRTAGDFLIEAGHAVKTQKPTFPNDQ